MIRPDPVDDTREFLLRQTLQLADAAREADNDLNIRENPSATATDAAWIAYVALTRLNEIAPRAATDVANKALRDYELWNIPHDAQIALEDLTATPR